MANHPDIVVSNKQDKKAVVIDVTIPSDNNMGKKEHEKFEKKQFKIRINVCQAVLIL